MLQKRERRKRLFGRVPVERPHGEMIVSPFTDSELLFEVLKGEETVGSIEFLVILPVAALYLSVVPWRVGLNELMTDAELG